MAERLLHDDSSILGTAGFCQLLYHLCKKQRRNGQIMRWPLDAFHFAAYRSKSRGIRIITVHIAEQRLQLFKGGSIDSSVLLQAFVRPRPQLLEVPAVFSYADYRHI